MTPVKKRPVSRHARELAAFAEEKGAYRARGFAARDVVLDPRVRLKCQIPLCPHFGRSLTCPPNAPSLDAFGAALARYRAAVLVQTRAPLGPNAFQGPALKAVEDAAVALHGLVAEVERKAMASGFPFALGLIGGHCRLCAECVGQGSGAACRRPFEARPSLEAVGVDVVETSARAGLPIRAPPEGRGALDGARPRGVKRGYAVIQSRSTWSICASVSSPWSAISLMRAVSILSCASPKESPISRAR